MFIRLTIISLEKVVRPASSRWGHPASSALLPVFSSSDLQGGHGSQTLLVIQSCAELCFIG